MAERERQRAAQAAKYCLQQAAKRKKAEAEEEAREKRELAAMSAAERKERLAQMELDAALAIAQAREDAEKLYIEQAIQKNPRLKTHFSGPEPPVDRSTNGFVESEEGECCRGGGRGFVVYVFLLETRGHCRSASLEHPISVLLSLHSPVQFMLTCAITVYIRRLV